MSHLSQLSIMCSQSKFKLLSSLILCSVLLSFNAPATAQSRSAFQSGYTLLERGWVNDAIETFQQAVQTNPRSIEAQLGLAIAYQRAGQDENAWKTYQTVLSLEPQNLAALAAIGELATYRSEWNPAGITALSTLLELQPQNSEARSQRALLYGYQGQFTSAIRDYEQVLSTDLSPKVRLDAAQIYTYSGNAATGLELFQQYLQTEAKIPDSAIKAYLLALQKTGNVETAIQVATDRLSRLPINNSTAFEVRSALAIAYQLNQQPTEAIAALAPLRQDSEAQLPLARALSEIGRQTRNQLVLAEASTLYQQVLAQTESPSTGLVLEAADTLSEQPGTRSIALQLYQQVLAKQPNRAVQIKAVWLSNQLGQTSRTELQQEIQQLTQPLPDTAVERQQLAQALIRFDPPDPVWLNLYQSLVDNEPFLQFRIAQMQLQLGDTAAARQALAAYRSSGSDPAADLLEAEIERQDGNLAASAQQYEAIAARNPDSPVAKDALRGLAGVRLAQGQPTAALKLYQQLQQTYPDDRALVLGSTAIAYRLNQIDQAAALSVLADWLAEADEMPAELFLLVSELPADRQRQPLYKALLELDPDNIAINRRWVQLQASQDPDRARARVNQLLAENPDRIETYLVQGELGEAIGDLDLASAAYETILARQPNQPDALAALAGVRFRQQRYAEAESLYQQVLAQRPEDVEIRRVLAELKAAQDQPIAAWQQFEQLQTDSDATDSRVVDRLRQLQLNFLRRRGFQPVWERY